MHDLALFCFECRSQWPQLNAYADLAFAKEGCAQLEEENKLLGGSREKRDNPANGDLIILQLETLLAHENSIYARENRFLGEIIEYHQLSMQDVVYLDEGG
ncbi:uncharacterized protein LOC120219272 [Hibiscus syriacus]|uniref:uncharacterized protein LOC120219272 n=1 Tax=Hibiscus syriacus TaxID=106335 RepID=UPI0019210B08|nr:uncharacterized protein LOC120219272 [Hibiscus syriacus]